MAVTGLPDPQDDHAVIMARFALECRMKLRTVTRKLERTLGPETADLDFRFGLHSGPVTAGVLVGERARFQLFGDTGTFNILTTIIFFVATRAHCHCPCQHSEYRGAHGEYRDAKLHSTVRSNRPPNH